MKELLNGLVTPEQAERFEAFFRFLVEKNQVMNLTAITDKAQVASLHFIDSLSIRNAVQLEGKALIDVGTGAGFPGIPLGIVCPGMKLTLLDSQGKRVDFLKAACTLTGVRAECIQGRAEELGLDKGFRESFDIAVSRAVARLDLLSELCLPLVKPGGLFIAMKGSGAEEEISQAASAIEKLGGKPADDYVYTVPGGGQRRLVMIAKVKNTPSGYPRRFSKIKSSPIK